MSLRVSLFRTVIQSPLTARDLTIYIPKLKLATVAVQSATLPTEQWKSLKVQLAGQEVEVPTLMQVSGDWTFTVADGTHTILYQQLSKLLYKRAIFDVILLPGVKLNLNNGNPLNTLVSMGQEAISLLRSSVQLGGCWVRSINPAQFSESQPDTPVMWTVTVHYNYVQALISKTL